MTQPTKVAGTLRRAVRTRAFAKIPGGRHMECAYYFIPGGRHMECAYYFIPGGRHMECAYCFDFFRLCPPGSPLGCCQTIPTMNY